MVQSGRQCNYFIIGGFCLWRAESAAQAHSSNSLCYTCHQWRLAGTKEYKQGKCETDSGQPEIESDKLESGQKTFKDGYCQHQLPASKKVYWEWVDKEL